MLHLITAFLAAIHVFFRSRVDTSLDVLALRQQVAVLKRKRPRPSLNLRSFNGQTKAQKVAHADPVKVDSKHYTVEVENEKVRVLRIKYGPREKSEMHRHPALVAIMITDCHARFTYPDGKTEEIVAKAGDVRPFPAFEHLPENLSDKPFEVIGVELKG